MKIIKKHKFTIFVIVIYILFVAVGFITKEIFFSNSGKPVSGNRLDSIGDVVITNDTYTNMISGLKENEKVSEVTYSLKVTTVNIVVTLDDSATLDEAKSLGNNALTYFSATELKAYDFQIFFQKTNEALDNFPIVGYKQNGEEGLVWSKDRAVSE